LGPAISMRRGREIGSANIATIVVLAEKSLNAGAVGAWRGTEDARKRRRAGRAGGPHRGCERVFVVGFLAGRDGSCGCVDERELRREQVAKEAGHTPSNIDAGSSDRCHGENFHSGYASGRRLPDWPTAHERQSLRDLLATGAQCCTPPEINDESARHLS